MGRTSARWADFSLFGHQIVAHVVDGYLADRSANSVDGDPVPVPHFGLALSVQQFEDFAKQLTAKGVEFIIKPHLRFVGTFVLIFLPERKYIAIVIKVFQVLQLQASQESSGPCFSKIRAATAWNLKQ